MNTAIEMSPDLGKEWTKSEILFKEILMDIERLNGHIIEWKDNSTWTFETQDDMIKVSEVSNHAVKAMSIRKKEDEFYYKSSRWDIVDTWKFESQKDILQYLKSISEKYANLRKFQITEQLKKNNLIQIQQEKEADLFLKEELEKTNTF